MRAIPFLAGMAMGAMALWMGHDRLMSGEGSLTAGALLFLLAHVAAVAALLAVALVYPPLRRAVRNHRPDLRHVAAMMAGMAIAAGGIHMFLHGGVV